jgi:hypothetical protein
LDGNGTLDNALGSAIASIARLVPFDLQGQVDQALEDGQVLVGFQAWADSLADDPESALQAYLLEDGDRPANPRDNFSGEEEFRIVPDRPSPSWCGRIEAGIGDWGPGTLIIRLPIFEGEPPLTLSLIAARVRGAVAADGLGDEDEPAILGGAIPQSSIDGEILPAVAELLDGMVHRTPCDTVCNTIRMIFDSNRDGSISPDEVARNPLVAPIFRPDVEIDGEPGLSLGLGTTAVRARIADAPAE